MTMETQSKKEKFVSLSKFNDNYVWDAHWLNIKALTSEKANGKAIITHDQEECMNTEIMLIQETTVDFSKFKNLCRVDGLNITVLPSDEEKQANSIVVTYEVGQCSTSSCMSIEAISMQEEQPLLDLLNNDPTTVHHNHQRNSRKRQRSSQNLAIVPYRPPTPPPQLPLRVVEKIRGLGGYDEKFVIRRNVTNSDLDVGQSRFTMTESKCVRGVLDHLGNDVPVIVIGPNIDLDVTELKFTKWASTKSYVLKGQWNEFVRNNIDHIKEKDDVQVWTFRVSPPLYGNIMYGFAIVKP
ncbi:hypothetical protein BVRB_5g107450 [Beta vulgaris subsp. vulgaris]|nr:hypothetical protein BVRB_5g107450 [Beta vulgaris subsp. vulgaris]